MFYLNWLPWKNRPLNGDLHKGSLLGSFLNQGGCGQMKEEQLWRGRFPSMRSQDHNEGFSQSLGNWMIFQSYLPQGRWTSSLYPPDQVAIECILYLGRRHDLGQSSSAFNSPAALEMNECLPRDHHTIALPTAQLCCGLAHATEISVGSPEGGIMSNHPWSQIV